MSTEGRCHLLELPAELRLRIFEYALAPTGVLSLLSSSAKRFTVSPTINSAILGTCRQINHEAADMLYSENEICLGVDAHDTCVSLKYMPTRFRVKH